MLCCNEGIDIKRRDFKSFKKIYFLLHFDNYIIKIIDS